MAQGLTDNAVARRLGVSVRTVRRLNDKVTGALDSTSRFETGMKASELGLIRSSELP
jgi:DNA-binding NarL/FixJ family response regulator